MLAEYDAGDREILDQDHVGRDLGNISRREADNEDATFPADTAQTLLECFAADGVEDDVDTPAVRQCAHPIAQIIGSVVDGLLGAVPSGNSELLGTARRRD